jgi:hypothetical protein
MHRDREKEMSLGFSNQVFTLAQMRSAIEYAYLNGKADGFGSYLDPEDVARVIYEVSKIPVIDVLSALQRLEEWRSSQRDHP